MTDDRTAWNAGVDLDFGPFGLDLSMLKTITVKFRTLPTQARSTTKKSSLSVLTTTGPFKLGLSYYDSENTLGLEGVDTKRYSGGVVYTYGPGMTLRGSVARANMTAYPV
ncbi:MAG: porin [Alphaproteobacteria bacterium]